MRKLATAAAATLATVAVLVGAPAQAAVDVVNSTTQALPGGSGTVTLKTHCDYSTSGASAALEYATIHNNTNRTIIVGRVDDTSYHRFTTGASGVIWFNASSYIVQAGYSTTIQNPVNLYWGARTGGRPYSVAVVEQLSNQNNVVTMLTTCG